MSALEPAGVFVHKIVVQSDDIDELNHVNNVVYVKYVQDVASAHWDKIAPEGFKNSFAWVVLRHEIDYKSPAVLGDEITAHTWVSACEGPRSDRHVELFHSVTGKLLAKAKTTWVLLDSRTRRPKRIEPAIAELFLKH